MNFSLSNDWINSLILRYDVDKIVNIKGLYFYQEQKSLICQHFFDFTLTEEQKRELKKYIKDGYHLKFKYINKSTFERVYKFLMDKNTIVEEIDKWEAPLLTFDNIDKYISESKHKQLKRNYKSYLKERQNYCFLNSNNHNFLELWNDVLKIDFHSWKKEENSDMKSLNREDLQYLPFCLNNTNLCNLNVIYDKNKNPLAYSLMMLGDKYWYAVKWGTSTEGRKTGAGFYCLFNHLNILSKNSSEQVFLDFWGRRSQTYDELRNNYIERYHFNILKKD